MGEKKERKLLSGAHISNEQVERFRRYSRRTSALGSSKKG